MLKKIYALIDANTFYVSCERIFRPDLDNVPVAVLSNNDGCIVALSEEVKRLGIKRGEPIHKVEHLIKANKGEIFSSNYELYGDISARLMKALNEFSPEVEVYSVDEAFLVLDGFEDRDLIAYGKHIRSMIGKWLHLPVSVGIGETKTLAKIANKVAKKYKGYGGVFSIYQHPKRNEILQSIKVDQIWGVGYRYAKKLRKHGIFTAYDLSMCEEHWVKQEMTIVGLKTVRELNSIPQIEFEDVAPPKKTIVSSRSFGKPISTIEELVKSVSFHTSEAVRKLREQKSVAYNIMVFIGTNPFKDEPQYANYISATLPIPSAFTPDFINIALEGLRKIFIKGFNYKRSGVMISGILQEEDSPIELFGTAYVDCRKKQIMDTMDMINAKFGKNVVHCGFSNQKGDWEMRRERKSPSYTTKYEEIPVVKAK